MALGMVLFQLGIWLQNYKECEYLKGAGRDQKLLVFS